MRATIVLFILGLTFTMCQESETHESDFTGREAVYALTPGSTYNVSGTVTFQEKRDGTALVTVALSGTEGNIQHPVHLHLGNISTPGAAVSALLNPIVGRAGRSETTLVQLADESPINYEQLTSLEACIKVHLSDVGPDKDIILAGGNIGAAAASGISSGRAGMAVCGN